MTQRSRSSSVAEKMEKLMNSFRVSSVEATNSWLAFEYRIFMLGLELFLYVLPELLKSVIGQI